MKAEDLAALRKRYIKGEHGVELIYWEHPAQLYDDAVALFEHVDQLDAEIAALRKVLGHALDRLANALDNEDSWQTRDRAVFRMANALLTADHPPEGSVR
jgi:hypothetical protein